MVFLNVDRIDILSFNHHRSLAVQSLTDIQRNNLLEKAGKNGWTAARLKHERDVVLEVPGKVKPPKEFNDRVDDVLADLPKGISKKLRKRVEDIFSDLSSRFTHEVEAEVKKRVDVAVDDMRADLLDQYKESQSLKVKYHDLIKGFQTLITMDEYKLIRGCLASDRQVDEL